MRVGLPNSAGLQGISHRSGCCPSGTGVSGKEVALVTLKDIKDFCVKRRDRGSWCKDCPIKAECSDTFLELPCLWDDWDIKQIEAVLEGKT